MILDRFKLTDQVAVVTGAGRGIGAATAVALAEAGADVVIASRTEAQLSDLDSRWVVPVLRCLEKLEAAAATWDPDIMAEPEWQTKVTPESETRKRVCRFEDDGKLETFHLHARFTPGAGRIHFRLVGEEGRLRIAHIGGKIRPDL